MVGLICFDVGDYCGCLVMDVVYFYFFVGGVVIFVVFGIRGCLY